MTRTCPELALFSIHGRNDSRSPRVLKTCPGDAALDGRQAELYGWLATFSLDRVSQIASSTTKVQYRLGSCSILSSIWSTIRSFASLFAKPSEGRNQ